MQWHPTYRTSDVAGSWALKQSWTWLAIHHAQALSVTLRKLHYIPLGLKLSYPWAENSASCRIIVMTSVKHMLWALSFDFKLTSLLPAVECRGQNPLQTHVLVSVRPRHQFYRCRMSHVFSPCPWTIHICVLICTLVLMLHGAHSIFAHCLKCFHSLWFFPFPILSLSIS